MKVGIDISENKIIDQYPEVLDILLYDCTTKNNILWATRNYEYLGENYTFSSQILIEAITGKNGQVIMPRILKDKILQQSRAKEMAEVFTPSWICNTQNNLIDNVWFGKDSVFNHEIIRSDGTRSWGLNTSKIDFSNGKSWQDYVRDTRFEFACGEAPYISSRYDTTTGKFISIENRIGILDRKLRVINENVDSTEEWLKAVKIAFQSTYACEWQGDSLLLAREAMLVTFIENYTLQFNKKPLLKTIKNIAYIISWNTWQMDGLKGVIPNSCGNKTETSINLFGETEIKYTFCKGCEKGDMRKHNGIYCLIKDWSKKDLNTGKKGIKIKFIDLVNNREK